MDTLDGGPGIDIVDYASSPTGGSVNLTTGAVSGGHTEGDTISNFEIVMGSNHDDVLIGNEQNYALYGFKRNDRLEVKGAMKPSLEQHAMTPLSLKAPALAMM